MLSIACGAVFVRIASFRPFPITGVPSAPATAALTVIPGTVLFRRTL